MDISFCWGKSLLSYGMIIKTYLFEVKPLLTHQRRYLYRKKTRTCARACLNVHTGLILQTCTLEIHAGVIDERTKCEHRGQEVDPAGED